MSARANSGLSISVVIPTYNRSQQTIAAIESVLAQTLAPLEVIVIDDGSTNGSDAEIRKFLDQRTSGNHPVPVHFFKKLNGGSSTARNAGIEKAQGEYIAFLDSDDHWLPEKLEWQVKAIEQFKNQCGACFTDSQTADSSGTDTSFRIWKRQYDQSMGIETAAQTLLARSFCGFWMSTLLVRADLIREIGGFDPGISFCEDRDLYFRLSRISSLAFVNKVLVCIDRYSRPNDLDTRPWVEAEVRLRGELRMMEKWLKAGETLPPDVRKIITNNLRHTYSKFANCCLETGRYSEAHEAVCNALKYEFAFGLVVKRAMTRVAPTLARRMTAKSRPYLS